MSFTVFDIGRPTTIPNWPTNDLAGLFDALSRWDLDPRLDFTNDPHIEPHPQHAPFRCPALRSAGKRYDVAKGHYVYLRSDEPIHPEAPNAVSYCGNFLGYSFGWNVATDDPDLIARLDAAIAANLNRSRKQ